MDNQISRDLQTNLDKTLQYFDLLEVDLNKTYGGGKWTVKQILCHITDAETVLYDRIRRTIAKPGQTVMGFEQDLWAEKLEYDSFPLELSKDIFLATRKAIIFLAAKYYTRYGDNEASHSRTGPKNLKHFFDKVVWHCEQHLAKIELALKD